MSAVSFQEVRSHDVVKRRTSKGGTTGRVVRFGTAQVIGDIVPTGAPVIGDGRYCAFQLELAEIRRGTFGRSGIALAKLADAMYADYGLEPLLGTEVRGFEQVTPEPMCDPLDGTHAARHRCYLTGRHSVAALDEIATPSAVYKVETRPSLKRHRTRIRLAKPRLRASEAEYAGELVTSADATTTDASYTQSVVIAHKATHRGRWNAAQTRWDVIEILPARTSIVEREVSRTLVMPASAMFVGHRLVQREPLASRKRYVKRASVTVAHDALPIEPQALERAIGQLEPGTRHVYQAQGVKVTISVSDRKRISVRIGSGADAIDLRSNRTALGAARRILTTLNA